MNQNDRSPLATDRMKKAIHYLCERLESCPEKTRRQLLQEAELKFDLSPLECEFLDKYLAQEA